MRPVQDTYRDRFRVRTRDRFRTRTAPTLVTLTDCFPSELLDPEGDGGADKENVPSMSAVTSGSQMMPPTHPPPQATRLIDRFPT